ncbi:hypothetical protein HYX19_01500 [Candidatus Woesearchaeota archaeon]|nr:hypothetical protein [Candidatus Woesearchaeota archaeon]
MIKDRLEQILKEKISVVKGDGSLESKLTDNKDLLLQAERYLGGNKFYIEYYNDRIQKNNAGLVYYHVSYNKKREVASHNFYVSLPSGAIVLRVPQSILGENVLGTAEIGTNIIRILDSLEGDEFLEVLYHESMHLKHPNAPEYEVRNMVSKTLPFQPKYHNAYYT